MPVRVPIVMRQPLNFNENLRVILEETYDNNNHLIELLLYGGRRLNELLLHGGPDEEWRAVGATPPGPPLRFGRVRTLPTSQTLDGGP